ncbi:Na/Pi cotransporter family protein [Helicobacter winghamensis]|uniref:Na/Pi-cotransporter n=1 Tax=Helicobacter winghamensis TaxID=157268 RepID=A0A2N3PHT4_9HELI|nr:Na/Pi symporter [Helicobacter winghamensis]EEO25563.1 putative Na/Pi-cotransporter II-like protein [Helicobacter winghamensis ATCC BAA-430]PKT78024.1 Na/Pi-cotransporter [Helicobacter winghamensis]PKT78287.1 Na/Pi-cotransporter [Helicobacter winghamensis]PKT78552.1 Na/Pi-cotransporter [Helicobacter winghamensis]PKT80119.1 Na/Pi-cotransporter [Helicobacter winghamensis]
MQNIRRYVLMALVVLLLYVLVVFPEFAKILAGVAILLIGMMNLSNGFKAFSGGILENILTKSTDTRFKSIVFGVVTTILMQSSTLVSVISISFLSAGLITLAQGIGIIFGANLGNSAGSWLIVGLTSINISMLAIPLIVCGVLLGFQKDSILKGAGAIFMGIGFFFLGVDYIKVGFESYKEIVDLSHFNFEGFRGVLIFVGLGALTTGIVQSSHATLAIIISALISGQIGFENALAATLGTSVGGVVTAVVASLSTNIEGKKLAIANCIFNFTIAIIVIVAFPFFVKLVNVIANFLGIEAANYALKTALFHTLFNLVAVLLISLFIRQIVFVLDKMIKAPKDRDMDAPLYLDSNIIEYPDTAIDALQKESVHLYNNAYALVAHTIGFNRSDIRGKESFDFIVKNKKWFSGDVDLDYLYKRKIKVLFDGIMEFATKAQRYVEDENKNHRIYSFKIAARNLTEATKNLKLIQANMKVYSNSKNPYLADKYNAMRKDLGMLLRSVEELKTMKDENAHLILKQLLAAKEMPKEFDYQNMRDVEKLISEEKISVANGTSILNDSAFVAEIAIHLIEAIGIVFSKENVSKLD